MQWVLYFAGSWFAVPGKKKEGGKKNLHQVIYEDMSGKGICEGDQKRTPQNQIRTENFPEYLVTIRM